MRPFWSFLELLSQARNFSRSKVHFPDLEVCCDWSTFFSAQVSRRSWARHTWRTPKNVCVGGWEQARDWRGNCKCYRRVIKLQDRLRYLAAAWYYIKFNFWWKYVIRRASFGWIEQLPLDKSMAPSCAWSKVEIAMHEALYIFFNWIITAIILTEVWTWKYVLFWKQSKTDRQY